MRLDMSDKKIKLALDEAKNILNDLGLENQVGASINDIIDALYITKGIDIKCGVSDFNDKNLQEELKITNETYGFVTKQDGQYIIALNKNIKLEQQRFAFAHELAHILMHKMNENDVRYFNKKEFRFTYPKDYSLEEKQANSFAAELLVPERILSKVYLKFNVDTLAKAFKVSNVVIANRMKDLKLGN